MASPVICLRSSSVQNGSFMIRDLWPNKSQANPVKDPAPQGPRYLRQPESALPAIDGNGVITREVSGLAAYILTNVVNGANVRPTPAQAVTIANNIIAEMRDGSAMTAAQLPGYIAVVAGFLVGSVTVADLLKILAGARYTLPVGHDTTVLQPNNAVFFVDGVYEEIVEEDSSFWVSLAEGQLARAKTASLVVVYDDTGAVI